MTREETINKLAHIICDAAKGGYIPFNVDGEYCAMSIARAKINEFFQLSSDTAEALMSNLDVTETKEKDLENEIIRVSKNEYFDFTDWKSIARHFYEFGLKSQKGE